MQNRLMSALAAASMIVTLAACTPRHHDPRDVPLAGAGLRDIHQRLEAVIARDGFEHGIRTMRSGDSDVDSIYVRIPLDSLRRRHPSLEKLMADVGRVCALPEFAAATLRIEIGAGDEQDRAFLRQALAPAVASRSNIEIDVEIAGFNDVVITAVHPRFR